MLNWRKPTFLDKDLIISRINEGNTDGCCYCFGNIISWRNAYNIEISEFENLILVRGEDVFGRYYVYPSGNGDIKSAILEMISEARLSNVVFRLFQLVNKNKETLENLFPGEFIFTYDRDNSEYVYKTKDLIDLPGKKYHSKKNHINAFFRNHTDISIEPITEDNISDCLNIEEQWLLSRDDETGELEKEHNAILVALKNVKTLGLWGAVLHADGKAVAFTLGESIKNNTFCTHFEKTLPQYRDAYPVINHGFTKFMLSSFEYVNREEDTGDEGLRKAKLSYHPSFLLNKYAAVLKDDINGAYSADKSDFPALKDLWRTVFSDENDVIDAFFKSSANLSDVFALKINRTIVSAFYLVDINLIINGETFKGKYLYAAATHPLYRKMGYMSGMIEFAKHVLSLRGIDYIVLYPVRDNLYDYYKRFGFSALSANVYHIKKSQIEKFKGKRYFKTETPYSDLADFQESTCYVKFSEGFLNYLEYSSLKSGVLLKALFDDEEKVYIIGYYDKNSDELIIEEALSTGGIDYVFSILADLDYQNVALKTPSDVKISGFLSENVKNGMILPLSDKAKVRDIYLGATGI